MRDLGTHRGRAPNQSSARRSALRSLALAAASATLACATLLQVPRDQAVLYSWSPRLSNIASHPQAPLYTPGPGYNTPLVEVTFPDHPRSLPYRFIVDTGQQLTSVSLEVAAQLDLALRQTALKVDGQPMPWARVDKMAIGDLLLQQVPVLVRQGFDPVGSSEAQVTVDGVLGMNLLATFAFELQPEQGRFIAHPAGSPLPGNLMELGSAFDRLVIAGGVGVPSDASGPKPTRQPTDDDEEGGWAPILIPTTSLLSPPAAALAPPAATRARDLPSGGPHLLQLATGRASTEVHPELLPWAGGTGTFATEALPLQIDLLDTMVADILDERPQADVLQEVTRYELPSLSLGSVTLDQLPLYHRDRPWTHAPLAAVLGADVLGKVGLAIDVSSRRAAITVTRTLEPAPSIQPVQLGWAEQLLTRRENPHEAEVEAMRRFVFAGRWPEAAQLASRIIQRDPSTVAAWMVLARQSERRDEIEVGLQFYRRLYWVERGRVPAILGAARLDLLAGDLETALQDLATMDVSEGVERARVWRARGQIRLARGEYDEAARSFHQAVSDVGDDAGARRGLAWLAFQRGRYDDAEGHLRAALNLSPDDPWAQDMMVVVLRKQGKEAAIDPWVETLARRFPYPGPDDRDPIAPLRVRLARERGQSAQVTRLLLDQDLAQREAAEASPAPRVRAHALEMRARLYLAARTHLSQALEYASQANVIDPTRRAGLLVGAEILRVMGDDASVGAYQRAWQATPFDLAAWLSATGWHVPEVLPEVEAPEPARPARGKRRPQRGLPDKVQ